MPTLLGKLLFVKPDSKDEKKREDYYCLIASLFFPWSQKQSPKSSDESWEQFIEAHQNGLSFRLQRIIYNLTLLHKSKEETRIDLMQMRAQEQSLNSDGNDFDDSSSVASNDSVEFDDNNDDNDDDDIDFSADIEQVLSHPIEFDLDFYSSEGLDACRNNGYVITTSTFGQPH